MQDEKIGECNTPDPNLFPRLHHSFSFLGCMPSRYTIRQLMQGDGGVKTFLKDVFTYLCWLANHTHPAITCSAHSVSAAISAVVVGDKTEQ